MTDWRLPFPTRTASDLKSTVDELEARLEAQLARLQAQVEVVRHEQYMLGGQLGQNAREVRNVLSASTLPDPELWQQRLAVNGHPSTGPVFETGDVCRQESFEQPEFAYWSRRLGQQLRYHRKLWEFVFICQAAWERGLLSPGLRGLGFGVGVEPLTALFAHEGVQVTATDLDPDAAVLSGWSDTQQHAAAKAALAFPEICPMDLFDERVDFRVVDMNAVPDDLTGFDFCWSACALEHLGSIQNGLDFVVRSIDTLKPGGWAIHTTELNLTSNDDTVDNMSTVLFRQKDFEALSDRLAALGHRMLPINFDPGLGLLDRYIDLPPFRSEPHLRLALWGYPATSVGVLIQKGGQAQTRYTPPVWFQPPQMEPEPEPEPVIPSASVVDIDRLQARIEALQGALDQLTGQQGQSTREVRNVLAASTLPDAREWQSVLTQAGHPSTGPVFVNGEACRQDRFASPEFAYWTQRLGQHLRYHRKLWEFFFVVQSAWERGLLKPGLSGLAFGVGHEPLVALFAAEGVQVTATDMPTARAVEIGWAANETEAPSKANLNRTEICPPDVFEDRVTYRDVDMNALPSDLSGYDFCWSIGSLEHLGSIQQGLDFIVNSLDTLKPGGWAIHTTELNLFSDGDTADHANPVLFRRRDFAALAERLAEQGHRLVPINFDPGNGPVDRYIDLSPYRPEPHLKLSLWGYPATSVGILIQKAGSADAAYSPPAWHDPAKVAAPAYPAPTVETSPVAAMAAGGGEGQRYFYLGPDLAVARMRDGFHLYVDPADETVAAHLIVNGYWEDWIYKVINRLVRPGDHIAEVGANFGYYTLAMARKMGPQGSIVTLEVNPRLASLVKRSVRFNGYAAQVTVLNNAAVHRKGPVSFVLSRTNAGGGTLSDDVQALGAVEAMVVTAQGVRLDDVAHPKTRLIRIDAEGSEPLILAGAKKLLKRKDIVVCMEWDIVQMQPRRDVAEFVDDLAGQGFRFWAIQYDASLLEIEADALKTLAHCDIVMCRQDPESP